MSESARGTLAGYQVTEGSFVAQDLNRYHVAYSSSKTTTSSSFEPLISTTPLNTQIPCSRPDHERLLVSTSIDQFTYEKESPLGSCPKYAWRSQDSNSNNRLQSVFSTNLYDLQESNGIFAAIQESQPEIFEKLDVSPRKEIQLDWTTRRRYEWNIECEGDFESFFEKL